MMESNNHISNLEKICRICCKGLDKTRRCKEVALYKELIWNYFHIDIQSDNRDVHPTCICEQCRKILLKVEKFPSKNAEGKIYHPQLSFYDFKPHHENCKICQSCTKAKKGGRPPLKSWSNRHNIINSEVDIVGVAPLKEEEIHSLNENVILNHAEKLGFTHIPNDLFMSFVKFYKPTEMMSIENCDSQH